MSNFNDVWNKKNSQGCYHLNIGISEQRVDNFKSSNLTVKNTKKKVLAKSKLWPYGVKSYIWVGMRGVL